MQGLWLDFRDAGYDNDQKRCFDIAINSDLKLAKAELGEGEVSAIQLCKEEVEDELDIRRFIERQLETDSMYKYQCIRKA